MGNFFSAQPRNLHTVSKASKDLSIVIYKYTLFYHIVIIPYRCYHFLHIPCVPYIDIFMAPKIHWEFPFRLLVILVINSWGYFLTFPTFQFLPYVWTSLDVQDMNTGLVFLFTFLPCELWVWFTIYAFSSTHKYFLVCYCPRVFCLSLKEVNQAKYRLFLIYCA